MNAKVLVVDDSSPARSIGGSGCVNKPLNTEKLAPVVAKVMTPGFAWN